MIPLYFEPLFGHWTGEWVPVPYGHLMEAPLHNGIPIISVSTLDPIHEPIEHQEVTRKLPAAYHFTPFPFRDALRDAGSLTSQDLSPSHPFLPSYHTSSPLTY